MKKVLLCSILLLAANGCHLTRIDDKSLDFYVDKVLLNNKKLVNKHRSGIRYYLPKTMIVLEEDEDNMILMSNNEKIYVYLDTVRFLNKKQEGYQPLGDYYYARELSYLNKEGYLTLEKLNNKIKINLKYNYLEAETIVSEENLNNVILDMFIFTKSVKYNKTILQNKQNDNNFLATEKLYKLSKSKGIEKSYLEVLAEENKKEEDESIFFSEDKINIKEKDER